VSKPAGAAACARLYAPDGSLLYEGAAAPGGCSGLAAAGAAALPLTGARLRVSGGGAP
jgi:hypothetical protein